MVSIALEFLDELRQQIHAQLITKFICYKSSIPFFISQVHMQQKVTAEI